jgi:secreted PhoX family phosphatase
LADSNKHNSNKGDTFGAPDGLWFDPAGNLWVQTDISTSALGKGDYANIATNMMLVADTESGELKRFLTGPLGCEVTGAAMTPDRKTMFVNIQHPGESPSERGDPSKPKAVSSFPDGDKGERPRSATIAITREDGGVILS